MHTVQDLIEEAHGVATQRDHAELTQELQELLGQKIVAYAVGDRHPKTIGRYARGEREPDMDTLGRLINLHTIVGILRHGMGDSAIKGWMMGSNPRLRGIAPIVAVHEGREYKVMGAARAFVTRH